MSIEEKAKAYDEALERARKYMAKGYDVLMPEIFPQLRESEDERIRKEIIKFIQDFCNPCDPDCDKWIAYLEKHKEQKPVEWSEEDERMLSRCEKSIEFSKQFADSDTFKKAKDNEIDWLENRFKSLRPSWKPSEHQMTILKAVKEYVGRGSGYWGEALGSLIDDLEKLM